ncbi:N-6 DNA methylase [Mycoplasmopsis sturni]|uniref:N-6 DNA methylase n=1 Tax=Mycoplasmopsis sturni TaxID=39047 RepID=UPI00068951BF|nr:N-6 DNA methylase [Mycoplasmopsis sturni]
MAAIKKNQLYNSLWESSNALRGGMDASQYKDYILTLLFVKYVTDKSKGQPYSTIVVPKGGSFDDMVDIIGDKARSKNIGEEMDKIIAKLAEANDLRGVIDNAHFNDETKLGKGQEMVDKLIKLINIFRNPELNFEKNRADGDDIIGDAYEFLMNKFATESGKSKGQFYTPAEVSRVLAKVIEISKETNKSATVYDPACGSGSLLIKALDEAKIKLAGYGQEKDINTAGLAIMNNVLHGKATTTITANNTFSNPAYVEDKDSETLKRFDYIVANPPFSLQNWKDGLKEYGRFDGYDVDKMPNNGDYAWLLHIIKSLKSNGKAAVILPHGVLFRGNTEGYIRKTIIDKGYIKGIIGLPANLFYGTGIPACIIVIDKEKADIRDSIFIIDASQGYVKDGNKNRLREQDIYKIVNTFVNEITDDPSYAKKVPLSEIKSPKNNYNLNIPRYIHNYNKEDSHDISAHMIGGIPAKDIDSMSKYWNILTSLKNKLFIEVRKGYYKLNTPKHKISHVITQDKDFQEYQEKINKAYTNWKKSIKNLLINIDQSVNIKSLIEDLSEKILKEFESLELLDKYDVYQVLLEYWQETMSDDVYLLSHGGFELGREIEKTNETKKDKNTNSNKQRTKSKEESWEGTLIPKSIVIEKYFKEDQENIDLILDKKNSTSSKISQMIEDANEETILFELIGDNGTIKDNDVKEKIKEIKSKVKNKEINELEKLLDNDLDALKKEIPNYFENYPVLKNALTDKGKITKTSIKKALQMLKDSLPVSEEYKKDYEELSQYLSLKEEENKYLDKKEIISLELNTKILEKYKELTIEEIKDLLIERKWFDSIYNGIKKLFDLAIKNIVNKITILENRYENTLGDISLEINEISNYLSTLVDELVGDEFDMEGLKEFKKLLGGK